MNGNVNISAEVRQAMQRFSIVGNSPALINAVQRAIKVAPIDLSVLVTGESGSGKEFFPKIIHNYGSRKHNKYIAVNCGAIPEGTIDSELFGHEKGSFTGAISARKGYFEEANGGTIFLDEVAELPMTTQARLLRVLETGEFIKVGSSAVQKTNIRIVAATNVDLVKAVAEGKFREDLYYRLSTIQIQVPPLNARGGDIALLARMFASNFAEKYMTPQVTFSEDARRVMMLYRWPGNVRQLKNVVEQIALFNAGEEVSGDVLKEYLPKTGMEGTSLVAAPRTVSYEAEREILWQMISVMKRELDELKSVMSQGVDVSTTPGVIDDQRPFPVSSRASIKYPEEDYVQAEESISLDDDERDPLIRPLKRSAAVRRRASEEPISLEDTEREAIIRALERNGGSRRKAAEELEISERTLYRKIKDYGLD
ncbi:MAG: sigma-54-dependent Fis family transcriptional regulator [Muribaculaceae bacterium]|nr:sigma-54-dependent Fis family transcriptional regulator [Muribaculaceae bacterium]